MKKNNIILLCIFIALFSAFIGFLIGYNIKNDNSLSKQEKDLVGTYRTQNWNGKEGIIVLNKDMTCIHPMGYSGTWFIENNKLYMNVDFPTIKDEGGTIVSTFEKTEQKKLEILIVDKGLMFSSNFFEKVN